MKRQESTIRKMVDASEKKVLKSLSDTSRLRSVVREECGDVVVASEKRVLEKVQESNDTNPVVNEPICLTVPHTKRRRHGGGVALSQTAVALSQTDAGAIPLDENTGRVASLIQKTGLTREKQNLFLVDDFF